MSLETELFALEKGFWTDGPEAYTRHCDDECLVVFVGMVGILPREDIAGTAEKGRWSDVRISPKGLVRLSDTSATIAYDCVARRRDGERYQALVSSGYVKRDDGWKLATHQQTEAPADDPA